jgi:hypothetical protein
MPLQRPQAALVARFHEFVHEGGGRGESDAEGLLASGEPTGERGESCRFRMDPARCSSVASLSVRTAPAPEPAAC